MWVGRRICKVKCSLFSSGCLPGTQRASVLDFHRLHFILCPRLKERSRGGRHSVTVHWKTWIVYRCPTNSLRLLWRVHFQKTEILYEMISSVKIMKVSYLFRDSLLQSREKRVSHFWFPNSPLLYLSFLKHELHSLLFQSGSSKWLPVSFKGKWEFFFTI